ncbi:MAG: CHC2 zinc finger domain-containing protein [Thermomicrobiales bacterium]
MTTVTSTPSTPDYGNASLDRLWLVDATAAALDDERQMLANSIARARLDLTDSNFAIDSEAQLLGGITWAMHRIRLIDQERERRLRAALYGYREFPGNPLIDWEARYAAAKRIDCADIMRERTGEWGRASGGRTRFVCPFHDDDSPSLVTYPPGDGWHCFGCGRGGDAVGLVAEFTNTNMADALRLLESGAMGVGGNLR